MGKISLNLKPNTIIQLDVRLIEKVKEDKNYEYWKVIFMDQFRDKGLTFDQAEEEGMTQVIPLQKSRDVYKEENKELLCDCNSVEEVIELVQKEYALLDEISLYDANGSDVVTVLEQNGFDAELMENDWGKERYRGQLVFLINKEHYRMTRRDTFNLEQWITLKKMTQKQIDKIKYSEW